MSAGDWSCDQARKGEKGLQAEAAGCIHKNEETMGSGEVPFEDQDLYGNVWLAGTGGGAKSNAISFGHPQVDQYFERCRILFRVRLLT